MAEGGGFFRGTTADQDTRFSDKNKKLLKMMKFEDILKEKVDPSKLNMDIFKPWITKRINDILGMEDDVVIDYVINQLEEKPIDPRGMQINLTGFLNAKRAREFMGQLWAMLLEAEQSPDGIPACLVDMKKEEIRLKKEEAAKIQNSSPIRPSLEDRPTNNDRPTRPYEGSRRSSRFEDRGSRFEDRHSRFEERGGRRRSPPPALTYERYTHPPIPPPDHRPRIDSYYQNRRTYDSYRDLPPAGEYRRRPERPEPPPPAPAIKERERRSPVRSRRRFRSKSPEEKEGTTALPKPEAVDENDKNTGRKYRARPKSDSGSDVENAKIPQPAVRERRKRFSSPVPSTRPQERRESPPPSRPRRRFEDRPPVRAPANNVQKRRTPEPSRTAPAPRRRRFRSESRDRTDRRPPPVEDAKRPRKAESTSSSDSSSSSSSSSESEEEAPEKAPRRRHSPRGNSPEWVERRK